MNPEIDNVGVAIVKGACNAEAKDLAIDLGQLELGSLFGEGVLKEIPYLKVILAGFKIPIAIRDQLFLRKVAAFLAGSPRIPEEEQEKFINEHLSDPKKAAKLGETIILILDKLDDMEKPEMVAKMFAAYRRDKIPFDTFRRLAKAIDLGSIDDLREFAKPKPLIPPEQQQRPDQQTQVLRTNLARTGLVSLPVSTGTVLAGVSFRENDLGKMFISIINEGL